MKLDWRSLRLLCALGMVWGSGYVIAKRALSVGVPPLGYAFWQCLGPALLLTLAAWRTHPAWHRAWHTHARYFFLCGTLGIVLPNSNMYWVAAQLPVALCSLLVNTVPLFSCVIAACVHGRHTLSRHKLLGIALGMIGMLLLFSPSFPSPQLWQPMAQLLLTPLSFALSAWFIERYQPPSLSPLLQAQGMMIMATLMMLPWVYAQHQFYPLGLQQPGTFWIVLEILLSSLGYLLFFQLLKTSGAVYYSLVGVVVVLTGLFWGVFLNHETLAISTGFAMMFMLCGIVLASVQHHTAGAPDHA